MGNCVSRAGGKEFLKSVRNSTIDGTLLDEPDSFFVYVKKKHKCTAGVLKVTNKEILFFHDVNDAESWPFLYLRRYGFTSGGVFFFESGRRCPTGEGLHTFQTCQSGTIFQLVQSRIQSSAITNFALNDSAGQSIVDNIRNACLYRNSRAPTNSRIHPLQRYFSEGINDTDGVYRSLRLTRRFYRNYHNRTAEPENKQQRITIANPKCSQLPCSVSDKNHEENSCDSLESEKSHSYANFKVELLSSSHQPTQADFSGCDRPNASDEADKHSSVHAANSKQSFFGGYVNVCEMAACSHDRCQGTAMSSLLDYAPVNVPQSSDRDIVLTRSGSFVAGTAYGPCRVNAVDYSEVDLERTHAAEIAMKAQELENPQRRHSSVP